MSSQRKKYVDHTVRCAACGDVLVEVFTPMITNEIVIGHRSLEFDAQILAGEKEYKSAHRRAREWEYTTHVLVVDPIHGRFYTPKGVTSACRCTYSRNFDVAQLLSREGKSSTEQSTHRGF